MTAVFRDNLSTFTLVLFTTIHSTSHTEARYSRFMAIGIQTHRQGETGLVEAYRGHRDRRKKSGKSLGKGVDKGKDVWYIKDKLKSNIK